MTKKANGVRHIVFAVQISSGYILMNISGSTFQLSPPLRRKFYKTRTWTATSSKAFERLRRTVTSNGQRFNYVLRTRLKISSRYWDFEMPSSEPNRALAMNL